ncbi:hypothetical protein [Nisaea sp.]|uniref:hypothetical protein n=1 Tax=Nisaea sp. TaxID=2024842 RepID=UPI003B52E198
MRSFCRMLALCLLTTAISIPTSSAEEWAAIDSQTSELYFALDIPQTIEDSGWNENYSQRIFKIVSSPRNALDPLAAIYLIRLAPNYFYHSTTDANSALHKFGYLKDDYEILQEQQEKPTRSFRASYLVVKARGRECTVFAGRSGQGGGDAQVSVGTSAMLGFYCQPEAEDLTEEGIATVLNAVGTKTSGSVAPAAVPAPSR